MSKSDCYKLFDKIKHHKQLHQHSCVASAYECVAKLHGLIDTKAFPLQLVGWVELAKPNKTWLHRYYSLNHFAISHNWLMLGFVSQPNLPGLTPFFSEARRGQLIGGQPFVCGQLKYACLRLIGFSFGQLVEIPVNHTLGISDNLICCLLRYLFASLGIYLTHQGFKLIYNDTNVFLVSRL